MVAHTYNAMAGGKTAVKSSFAKTAGRHFQYGRTRYSAEHASSCQYGTNTWTKSTLSSDENSIYRKFSEDNGHRLVQIKGRKTVKGIYHIQYLNAYHTKLKAFVASFKGVSSKYLNNYLVWNNAVEHKGGSLREKTANILNFATSALFEETCLAVPLHPPIPFLVLKQS